MWSEHIKSMRPVYELKTALNVQVRSEFDELLLNHARECGAKVFEETRVKSLQFSTTDPTRPISASWERKSKSTSQFSLLSESTAIASSGSTSYDYLIDATGREGLMNTYLKHRQFNASLKNIAIWGYWSDTAVYGQGTSREGAPWFEALTGSFLFVSLYRKLITCFKMKLAGPGLYLCTTARRP